MKKRFTWYWIMAFVLILAGCRIDDETAETTETPMTGETTPETSPTPEPLTLMEVLQHIEAYDNYTITLYLDTEFGDIEVVVKTDGDYVYIVDFMNSPFQDDSIVEPIASGAVDTYGEEALAGMLLWMEGIVFPNTFFPNAFLMMMDHDLVPLLDPSMYEAEGDVFTLKPEAHESFALAIAISRVLTDFMVFRYMEDFEDLLETWFDDHSVDYPGIGDPDELQDGFRAVFEAEWDGIEDTVLTHTITAAADELLMFFAFEVDGFAFDLTLTFHDYDETTVDHDNDRSFLRMMEDIMTKYPMIFQLTMINMAAKLHCNDHDVVCAIDDILTMDMLEDAIWTVEQWSYEHGFTVDGAFLVEVYRYDDVEETFGFRIAYELVIDGIVYRFCGDIDLLEGGDVAFWILEEGEDGFDDAEIDFATPALPPDTNPDD